MKSSSNIQYGTDIYLSTFAPTSTHTFSPTVVPMKAPVGGGNGPPRTHCCIDIPNWTTNSPDTIETAIKSAYGATFPTTNRTTQSPTYQSTIKAAYGTPYWTTFRSSNRIF